MTRIAILGDGFIGRRLRDSLAQSRLLCVDITDRDALVRALHESGCDVVINTAAKTGRPNVDWCEAHQLETVRSNVHGALTVAEACDRLGLYLLHLGSACVFFGAARHGRAWNERDHANPQSFYTRTKYASEIVLQALPNVAIARLRLPIDSQPGPRNFITKLAAYRSVVDVSSSATIVSDLVRAVDAIIHARATGIFHVTNPGTISNRRVLALYKQHVDPEHSYELVSERELYDRGLALAARSNCEVASDRLAELGMHFEHIDSALERTLREYGAIWRARAAAPQPA